MFRFLKNSSFLLLAFLLACSSGSSSQDSVDAPSSLITITDAYLKANSSHLSGTLTIYPESDSTQITQVNLLFAEDSNGNLTVSSPVVNLKKTTIYRFVMIFYWDDIPFAYVDTIQATGADSTTELSYSESLLVYNASPNNPDISASISEGILPNLDADEDGYNNFEELRAGTNSEDANSTPPGPAIIWNNLSAGRSVNGIVTIDITAIDPDGIADLQLTSPARITDKSLSELDHFVGEWDTRGLGDGDYTLIARAVDGPGNVSESQLVVNISNSADHSGPVVSIFVYASDDINHEFNLQNNEHVYGDIKFRVSAEDQTAVGSLLLLDETIDNEVLSLLEPTQTESQNPYLNTIDTTLLNDGYTISLAFLATDTKGQSNTATFEMHVQNHPIITYFSANQFMDITISNGDKVKIGWSIDDADNIFISNSRLDIILASGLDLEGEINIPITDSGPYQLTAERHTNVKDFIVSQSIVINVDNDRDGFNNELDNCDLIENQDQDDMDDDNIGDVCDDDKDGDGFLNNTDNCQYVNNNQSDIDNDRKGDACDNDIDGDGLLNDIDNCDFNINVNQRDTDGDGIGDACDFDVDGDFVLDVSDNCLGLGNNQADMDGDNIGDDCDDDIDGDGYTNSNDCNPRNATIYPGAREIKGDGIDQDCNGRDSIPTPCRPGTC